MKNKEAIKHVYDEIHAPDALFGKVMEMDRKESKIKNVVRYAMGTVAALVLAFITSNGICYAATGQTWISKAMVYINGQATEAEITWHKEGDQVYGEMEVDVEEGTATRVDTFVSITDDVQNERTYSISEEVFLEDEEVFPVEDAIMAEVKEEEEKVYLITEIEKVDITEDFRDGEATGSFVYCGLTMRYIVTGTVEKYEISITCE